MTTLNPSRVRPLAAALYTQLRDGQWHDLEDVYAELRHAVPAEVAVRYRNRPRSTSIATDVGRGQRDAARNAVHAAKLSGHIERDGNQIRLSPTSAAIWNNHLDSRKA